MASRSEIPVASLARLIGTLRCSDRFNLRILRDFAGASRMTLGATGVAATHDGLATEGARS